MIDPSFSSFAAQGFKLVESVLPVQACEDMLPLLPAQGQEGARPGCRDLLMEPWCAALSRSLRAHSAVSPTLAASSVAVQCTYFEKSANQNWLVPVHQDLSIPVAERVEHPALSGWSVKGGQYFVQAPVSVLNQLVAIRLHLDDCGEMDGPLRVVPGSHARGVLSPNEAIVVRRSVGHVVCTVPKGGVLVMKPLLLHASSKSTGKGLRRVLHFLFGPPDLPCGLRWAVAVSA
ncbi:phytanoyl-CoA dioxygenase family protein [Hydrogenophaga sp. 5NK40-0174]|uniref:phytanoyl-CoA dioxygenase family protein n=1 Tax=Hydrogenophaga sp. 5NK40-0174 TaxID=3127649 RepID=UPI0031096989